MPAPHFDPRAFFDFDVQRGAVRARGGQRVLMVSEEVLASLLATAMEHGDLTAVRQLGSQLGSLVRASLTSELGELSASEVLEHTRGVLALFGWGRLGLERWGSALVLSVEEAAPLDADHLTLAALLGGLFSQLSEREVACVPMQDGARFLMVDPGIAEQVWSWACEGQDVATIVARLGEAEEAA